MTRLTYSDSSGSWSGGGKRCDNVIRLQRRWSGLLLMDHVGVLPVADVAIDEGPGVRAPRPLLVAQRLASTPT